jgi:hypothetical protein
VAPHGERQEQEQEKKKNKKMTNQDRQEPGGKAKT